MDTQAGSDALTGLLNHRAFRERLVQEVARAQRHGRPLTAGIVDVDAFQDLTDQLGVRQADGVLAEIAQALREGVRDEDVVARLAGDGFGVIFVESDPQEAFAATDRARTLVARASSRHRVQATVSAGLCDLELGLQPGGPDPPRRDGAGPGQGPGRRPLRALRPRDGRRVRRPPAPRGPRPLAGAARPARAGPHHRRQGPDDAGALRARGRPGRPAGRGPRLEPGGRGAPARGGAAARRRQGRRPRRDPAQARAARR